MGEGGAGVVVASNRGPVSFSIGDDGALVMRRGGGGLVSGLSAVAAGTDVVWVCAALSEPDRRAAGQDPKGRLDRAGHETGGSAVRMLDIPAETFDRAYGAIANSTLWFVHHLLYDIPTRPSFDARWRDDWAAYTTYNQAFADALAEEAAPGARVAVQDYHLTLVPGMLRERRPDVRIAHFSHTPWAPPQYYRLLPADVARAVIEGILGADHAGFLSARWAEEFLGCCAGLAGARVDRERRRVAWGGRIVGVGVHGLGVDGQFLRERSRQPDVQAHRDDLAELVGDKQVLLRVDRTELSKNIVRGLAAYRELLRTRPAWHGRVIHLALAYPSRQDLPEYRAYTADVRRLAAEIEHEFATPDWRPLILEIDVEFSRSLAAYRLADVALVNPIRDGMNLVAKEVPVVSERGCALVLSQEAGAADDLGPHALLVNPFDVSATAEALDQALSMPQAERTARTRRLADAATALPPGRWFAGQLAALGS